MQNQRKLVEIIQKPYEADRGTLSFLRKVTETYPYCQSAQILLAKNLQQLFKPDFEHQVNKASAYAVNRRKFQRFISDRDKPELITEEKEKDITQTSTYEESRKETEILPETSKSLPDNQSEKHEQNIQPDDSESLSEVGNEEVSPDTLSAKKDDESKKTNVGDKVIAEGKKDKLSLLDIVKKRLLEIHSKNKTQSQNGEKEKQLTEPEIVKEEPEIDSPVSENKIHSVDSETPHQEKPKHKIPDFIYGNQTKKPDINYLIEKFLKEEPRIQMKKDLPEEQEDLSASSTAEDPQLATETLALVYLKQGRKEEALDVYEKLCLKFPEKSSYFAKKILDIKNEINP
jgi:hypothetical protein